MMLRLGRLLGPFTTNCHPIGRIRRVANVRNYRPANRNTQITTAPNIANAIIEINDEDNFKFLRDANIAGKHELFNIEQYERNQAKEEEDKKGNGASSGSDDQANATSNNTVRLDDEDAVIIDTFMDTEDIVNELKSGGFTGSQAEVIMCVAREALQRKMDWLRTELAPKVDLENESYLFQAAHNELLVEVTNAREIALMNLQNSSIILKRLLNNLQDETSTKIQLNDDTIKMELSQFKHENNLQQRSLEIKNTDLNNRIISELMSGLRSNIEQFRWELTRAGIFAIMLLAASILGGWSFAKTKVKNVEEKKEKEPELSYRHEPADEESHDYEADWDENVPVQLLGEASRK